MSVHKVLVLDCGHKMDVYIYEWDIEDPYLQYYCSICGGPKNVVEKILIRNWNKPIKNPLAAANTNPKTD